MIFGLLMILSTSSHFIGDNLVYLLTEYKDLNCDPNSTDTETCGNNATVSAIHLLIFGIIGFRFIPLLEKKATHILKKWHNNESGSSDIDDKTNFYKTAIEPFAMITELDAWYTAIIAVAKDRVFSSACSKYVLYGSWVAFGFAIITMGTYFLLKVIDFWCTSTGSDIREQKHRHRAAIALIHITTWITSGLYILGDNKHPLDCYEESIPTNKIHFIFVCGSTAIFFNCTTFLGPFLVNFVADLCSPCTTQTSKGSSGNSQDSHESENNTPVETHDEKPRTSMESSGNSQDSHKSEEILSIETQFTEIGEERNDESENTSEKDKLIYI